MFTSLKRIFKQGFLYFRRQDSLTIAAILLISATLSLLTLVFLMRGITEHVLNAFQEKLDISVYFKEDTPSEDILLIQEDLKKLSEIKEVEYVSKEDAMEHFRGKYSDNQMLMDSLNEVGDNPFLGALNIKVWGEKQYEDVVNFLEASTYKNLIDNIDYRKNKEMIDRLYSIISDVVIWGLLLSVFLALIAVITVFNTIRLAIASSKKEIEVMHLVGAHKSFVVGPYMIQGALIGVAATLLVLAAFTLLVFALGPKINAFISGFNLVNYFFANLGFIFLLQLAAGVGLGSISGWLAAKRYIR